MIIKIIMFTSVTLSLLLCFRNFVVMPICGIVQGRGWQIISVALEPKCFGDYCENWDLVINKVQKVSGILTFIILMISKT